MLKKIKSKSGQVTIFVIIAIVIVIGVVLFFSLNKNINPITREISPQGYLDSCVKSALTDATDTVEKQGGSINPKNYVLYNNITVEYLCYTNQYYVPCVNQQPLLQKHVENEIAGEIKKRFDSCLINFKKEYGPDGRGYTIDSGSSQVIVELQPKKIIAIVTLKLVMTKGKTVINIEELKSSLSEPLYELIMLANEIINQEITYRQFDFLGYMLLHHEDDIERTRVNEATIYTLKDRKSSREFHFALRNWVMPPGF